MTFELVISTMHKNQQQVLKMLDTMRANCNALIVVQCDTESYEELQRNKYQVRIFYTKERGLSKSRNMALQNSMAEYLYIMDDDVQVNTTEIEKLVKFMAKDDVAVATCRFQHPDGTFPKVYPDIPYRHNMFSTAKVASIEICVKNKFVRNESIVFDERFGLGTLMPSGEEYIFLTDCLKAGLKVKYFPINIGIHPNVTSGMDFFTSPEKTLAKREMFKRIFTWKSPLFIFAFWLKKISYVAKQGYALPFTRTLLFGLK